MKAIARFLSPKRMWHNLWTHFSIPMLLCSIIALMLFTGFAHDAIFNGVILALTFTTAASCIRRRFGVPFYVILIAAALGLLTGILIETGNVSSWLLQISIGLCVIISCWTRRFYLQIIFVTGWFTICFGITWLLLTCFVIPLCPGTFGAILLMTIPFILAPYFFLGGLPFGDESFNP